jgi:hypothetical protein
VAFPHYSDHQGYPQLVEEIRHDVGVVAARAEQAGIDSSPLTLFAEDPDGGRYSLALAVVERLCTREAGTDTNGPKRSAKRRIGRPKKSEKDSTTKVVAALSAHHDYQEGGSVTDYEPATNRGLAEEFDLSANALSRFLKAQLGEGGDRLYKIACRNRTIGRLLSSWNRELPARTARLLPHESGCEDDQ